MLKGRFTFLMVAFLMVAIFSVFMLGNWTERVAAQEEKDGPEDDRGGRGGVTLEIRGDEGTGFSGACSIGGERREISGQAPESFEFDLEGQRLSCEIGEQGGGSNELEVVLSGENVHAVQRLAGGGQSTSKLTYDGSGSVSVISSSSRATAGDDLDSSLSKSQEKALKNLDDRIEQSVDDIVERIAP